LLAFADARALWLDEASQPRDWILSDLQMRNYTRRRTREGLLLRALVDEGKLPADLRIAVGGAGAPPYLPRVYTFRRGGLNGGGGPGRPRALGEARRPRAPRDRAVRRDERPVLAATACAGAVAPVRRSRGLRGAAALHRDRPRRSARLPALHDDAAGRAVPRDV